MDRVSDFESEGWGFEPLRAYRLTVNLADYHLHGIKIGRRKTRMQRVFADKTWKVSAYIRHTRENPRPISL